MKKLIFVFAVLVLSITFKANAAPLIGGFQYGYFYNSLAPYGNWMEIDGGVTVWRPTGVNRFWEPYREGQWIWTNDGWYWDSYEPFGYIVFHYGRWYYDDYYGWLWVPDNEWAPAWVEWRYDNSYIGWAPLSPYASFSISIGIHFTHNYYTPYNHWHFVSYKYFCNPHVYNHFVDSRIKYRVYSGTKYRTDYGYSDGRVINRGVNVDYIRQRSGQSIREKQIERVRNMDNLRGQNNSGRDVVRAYVPSRDEVNKVPERKMDIQRGSRSSSLDVNRIGVGSRDGVSRTNERGNVNNARPNVNRDQNTQDRNSRIVPERNQKADSQNRERTIVPRENPNSRQYNNNSRPEVKKNNERSAPQKRQEVTPPATRQSKPEVRRESNNSDRSSRQAPQRSSNDRTRKR